MTLRLERLKPPKKVLVNFSKFLAAAHIFRVNCDEMAGDRLRQYAHEIFLALNADFSNASFDPLGSRKPVEVGIKEGCPLNSGYFTAIISSSMKTVPDRHRYAAYHNKH